MAELPICNRMVAGSIPVVSSKCGRGRVVRHRTVAPIYARSSRVGHPNGAVVLLILGQKIEKIEGICHGLDAVGTLLLQG